MNIKKLRDTLEKLKGKHFDFAGTTYLLESFTINANVKKVSLQTDRRYFTKDFDEVEEFLSLASITNPELSLQLSSGSLPENQDQHPKPFANEDTALADEMIQILKANIQKVSEDKSYIPQAQAINNNINSIINLTKLKLDVYKQFKGKRSD